MAGLLQRLQQQNFGPNDSVIASGLMHPQDGLLKIGKWFQDNVNTAAGIPNISNQDEASIYAYGPSVDQQAEAANNLSGLLQTSAFASGAAPASAGGTLGSAIKTRMGDVGFDPRFTPRKLQGNELDRLNNLTTTIDVPETQIKQLSLADYEGYPFITSMSDRTNVGQLQSINGVPLNVDLQGGQGYMFNNPGQVWASGASPVSSIMKHATNLKEWTGKDPLYLPFKK